MADEETGNDLGIKWLLDNHPVFGKDDLIVLIVVPDGGEPDGSMIEVAAKGILWVKVTVKGKQTHGSTPDRGINAHLGQCTTASARRPVHDGQCTTALRRRPFPPIHESAIAGRRSEPLSIRLSTVDRET